MSRNDIGRLTPIRRIAILGALTGAVFSCTPAVAHHDAAKVRYFAHRCADSPTSAVLACIHRATIQYHQPYRLAVYIANRESRLDPTPGPTGCNLQPVADGEHACGLFEFLPSTWAATRYAHHSYFSAKWSSLAYGWARTHWNYDPWRCC